MLFGFKFNKFLPSAFIISDVGVTTAKKTMPIITGDMKFPNIIPNLNQILFRGDKIDEFNRPKIKKITATIIDHTLTFPSFNNGNIDMIRKNIKKTTPKLLLEEIFISFFFKI